MLTTLLECKNCSCRFFSQRFDQDEITQLYTNYRGATYFTERHKYEFWYSKRVNDAIGNKSHEISTRKTRIKNYLESHVDIANIRSVMDFGGDRGQFIPSELGQQKYIFDISGINPVPGVSVLTSEDELGSKKFDLVMLCHVLEHYSNPSECLDTIKKSLNKDDSFIFIELPYERYNLSYIFANRYYRKYLMLLMRIKPLLYLLDFVSTVFRIKCNVIPPGGFAKLHEHITFFNEESLSSLLQNNGFSILNMEVARKNKIFASEAVLLCVAKLA